MNVAISVPGTFHAFTIAEGLEAKGALHQVYTSYPRFGFDTSLEKGKVTPIRYPELFMQAGIRFPIIDNMFYWTGWNNPTRRLRDVLFDQAVSRRLESTPEGIFLGFSGVSLKSLKVANSIDLATIVERSSTHIQTQKEILETEYEKFDAGSAPISERHVRREEKEYERANYISVPSDPVYESFKKHGFDDNKLIYLPFGIDPPQNDPKYETEGPFRVLFVGRVSLRKGAWYLLNAWDELDLPDTELVFTSNIAPELKSYIDAYRERDDIQFLEWVDDLDYWYNESDVFVFPSLEEGSAIVTYEAMAHGLPVVTTFNSGWVGQDEKHGIEIPIRDSKSIVRSIQRLYENEDERKRLGRNARDLILRDYMSSNYIEMLYSEYLKILRNA